MFQKKGDFKRWLDDAVFVGLKHAAGVWSMKGLKHVAKKRATQIAMWPWLGCGRPRGFFFRIRGVYSKTHNRSSNHAERVRAPTFSNTERSQYSGLDCAVMPDMSSLGFSCGSVEVAIVWCGSTQDHASSRTLRPRQISRGFLDDGWWLLLESFSPGHLLFETIYRSWCASICSHSLHYVSPRRNLPTAKILSPNLQGHPTHTWYQ